MSANYSPYTPEQIEAISTCVHELDHIRQKHTAKQTKESPAPDKSLMRIRREILADPALKLSGPEDTQLLHFVVPKKGVYTIRIPLRLARHLHDLILEQQQNIKNGQIDLRDLTNDLLEWVHIERPDLFAVRGKKPKSSPRMRFRKSVEGSPLKIQTVVWLVDPEANIDSETIRLVLDEVVSYARDFEKKDYVDYVAETDGLVRKLSREMRGIVSQCQT